MEVFSRRRQSRRTSRRPRNAELFAGQPGSTKMSQRVDAMPSGITIREAYHSSLDFGVGIPRYEHT